MKKLIISLISLYQNSLSLILGSHCRFYPSCSQYTKEAVDKYGVIKGGWLGLRRLSHCHPWHEGGIDPVPDLNSADNTVATSFTTKTITTTNTKTNSRTHTPHNSGITENS